MVDQDDGKDASSESSIEDLNGLNEQSRNETADYSGSVVDSIHADLITTKEPWPKQKVRRQFRRHGGNIKAPPWTITKPAAKMKIEEDKKDP